MAIPRDDDEADRFMRQILAPWRDSLITTAKGSPKAILANAITAFREAPEWAARLQFDAFKQTPVVRGQLPWTNYSEARDWTESDDIRAADWLQHNEIIVSPETAAKAIELVSRDQLFHPILDYLKTCEWDGVARLDKWLVTFLGAEDSEYIRAIGARWLISAVARVMQPGCKADCALILEGRQGAKKSTALSRLFDPWFTDDIADFGTKDASMQLPGAWCLEIAELDAMGRGEVSRIKAFMSRRTDRYRPAYGHRVIEQPRQSVFGGTVNHNEYLRDETGGRRFWPFPIGIFDIEGLASARDQLWAEARDRYVDGSVWWLENDALVAVATVEQDARRISDPWLDDIQRIVATLESTTASELLKEIGIPLRDQQQIHQNRAAACLKALGWRSISMRYRGVPRYRYVPNGVVPSPTH